MRFNKLANAERQILTSGSSHNLAPFNLAFNDGKESLNGFTCRRSDGHANYYYNEKINKERIVLHFTAGHLKADINTLMKTDFHVSTPFLIARNGVILQLFSSALWSYHLGPGSMGGNKDQSKRTIGIEITNYGILKKKGDELHTIYSKPGSPDVYCRTTDDHIYTELPSAFRTEVYYDRFSDNQYDSIIVLLRYLTNVYNIPKSFLSKEKRYSTFAGVANFKGIVSHVNYRPSGKWDIGPAFDWDRVIQGVKAEKFVPATQGLELPGDLLEMTGTLESSIPVLKGETEADDLFGLSQATSENDEEVYGKDGPGE